MGALIEIEHDLSMLRGRDKERFKEYNDLETMLYRNIPNLDFNHPRYASMAILDYKHRAIKEGYTKEFGAKAKAFFHNKTLICPISKGEYLLYRNPMMSRSSITMSFYLVKEFKTLRGTHYLVKNNQEGDDLVFSSHFLDRFQSRMNGAVMSREESICGVFDLISKGSYVHRLIGHNEKIIIDVSLEVYLEEGMILGKSFQRKEDKGQINYLRTYVPLDMMYRDQLERHAKAYMTSSNSYTEIIK